MMKKLLKEKDGMTLIEVVAALAIMSVIASAVSLMLVTAVRANSTALQIANARFNASAALSIIKSRLLFASAAELRNDSSGASARHMYSVSDPSSPFFGRIVIKSADGSVAELYDQTGLENLGLNLRFSASPDRVLTVFVSAHEKYENKTCVSFSTSFRLVNVGEAEGIVLAEGLSDTDGDGAPDASVLGFSD